MRNGVLGALVVLAFLAIGLVRNYPYVDNVTPENSRGDDWLTYEQQAIDILDHGITMPGVTGAYYAPAGFLYNYFVAAVYGVAGRSSGYVYVAHSALLGVCAFLMYLFARPHLPRWLAYAYLAACSLVMLVAFRDLGRRMLSENLALAIYPLVLLYATRAPALSGFCAGLLLLTRPNLILFPALIALLLFASAPRGQRVMRAGVFALATLLTFSILPLRNAAITGRFELASIYDKLLPENGALELMLRKLLFCFGIFLGGWDHKGADHIIHKQWLLISAAAVAGVIVLAVRRRIAMPDLLCLALIAAAYIPFALLPKMGGYGLRFQTTYAPALLFLAVRGVGEVMGARRNKVEDRQSCLSLS